MNSRPPKKKSSRRYSPRASKKSVRLCMSSNAAFCALAAQKKVTSRKQAITIGLSETRKESDKVPSPTSKAPTSSSSAR